jgi:hypothetical protein
VAAARKRRQLRKKVKLKRRVVAVSSDEDQEMFLYDKIGFFLASVMTKGMTLYCEAT